MPNLTINLIRQQQHLKAYKDVLAAWRKLCCRRDCPGCIPRGIEVRAEGQGVSRELLKKAHDGERETRLQARRDSLPDFS